MNTQTETVQSPVTFDKIGQIAIGVSDPARAKDFYQNTLGMKLLFEAGSLAFFQCGEVRLMISPSNAPPGERTILYFPVPDIHQAHVALLERHVEFIQPPHMAARMADHELWLAFLKDPDGNTLGMMSEVRHG